MSNENQNAYALTTLCPLIAVSGQDASPAALIRDRLHVVNTGDRSPMAKVPNVYFCRFLILDDVIYQSKPHRLEHLKSQYLVFEASLHGKLEPFLEGMWHCAEPFIRSMWEFCIGFAQVQDARTFAAYIAKCQVKTTFFFNGSTDEPLAEQLKSLYLKQEFSKFAYAHQGLPAKELQTAFKAFIARVEPENLARPTWRAGATDLTNVVIP
jgi:hypothetical protein